MARFALEHLGEPCEVCELRPGRHVHHVKFRSRCGDDVASNFMWVCEICDADHGSLPNVSRYAESPGGGDRQTDPGSDQSAALDAPAEEASAWR